MSDSNDRISVLRNKGQNETTTSSFFFKFYGSVYQGLITALGEEEHPESKVSVKIALGERQLTWDFGDARGAALPQGSGFGAA